MGLFADVTEEFKTASPGGKALMIVAVLVVAGLGYYVYLQKSGNAASTGGTLVPVDTTGGTSSTGGTSTSTGGTSTSTGGTSTGVTGTPIISNGGKPITGGSSTGGTGSTGNSKGSWVTVTKWPSQYGTLWGIAQAKYGNGSLWTKIASASQNKGINPKDLHVGQKIWVPAL